MLKTRDNLEQNVEVEKDGPLKPILIEIYVATTHPFDCSLEGISQNIGHIVKFLSEKTIDLYNRRVGYGEFREIQTVVRSVLDSGTEIDSLKPTDPQTIVMVFQLGDYSDIESTTENMFCRYKCGTKHVMDLPDVQKYLNIKMNVSDREKVGFLMGHIAHQMFSALGAYVSDHGVMSSPPINLLRNCTVLSDFSLDAYVDPLTFSILTESLSSQQSPDVNFRFRLDREGCFLFDSTHCITAYVFLNKNKYTPVFELLGFLPNLNYISVKPPNDWDSVLICHRSGPFVTIEKSTVEARQQNFRLKSFC